MLMMSIPVIAPIEITFGGSDEIKLLPAASAPLITSGLIASGADYSVETVPAHGVETDVTTEPWHDPLRALADIERVAKVIAYPEADWWRERLAVIRARLEQRP